jgi:CRISPR-associated protein Cmr3
MTIAITPLDTVIFKDGKPFDKSEDAWSNSMLLPTPSTIYGALRAIYYSQHPDELKSYYSDGAEDKTKNLKINAIYLKYNNDILFPMPSDCVKLKNENIFKKLKYKKSNLTNSILPNLLFSEDEVENVSDYFFDEISFEDYIDGREEFSAIDLTQIISNENKIGISRNSKTKTVDEGLLYRVNLLRYEDKNKNKLQIIVDFEGLEIDNEGLLRIGGEAKAAYYREIEDGLKHYDINEGNIFKLYLLTPAIFSKGWIPKNIDEKTLEGNINGVKVKLLSCAVGKPQYMGGWDIKENRAKPMFKAVPAGSVYYFEVIDGDVKDLHLKSISDYYRKEGYGIAVVVGEEK